MDRRLCGKGNLLLKALRALYRKNFRAFIFVCIVTVFITAILSANISSRVFHYHSDGKSDEARRGPRKGFLVYTPGCKMADVDPFHQSIRHLVYKAGPISCDAERPITYIDGAVLRVNKTIVRKYYNDTLDRCGYQTISRPEDKNDNVHEYSSKTYWFSDDVKMTSEFIRVACYGKSGRMLYTNFHPFILDKPDVERRCEENFQKHSDLNKPAEKLNVIIVGVDSVSRLNFMRQMPKTRRYLRKNLKAVEMTGYNKVADNTFVNLSPMFAGKFVEELPWDETIADIPFDNYNFVWKDYKIRGYRTLFAEDAPNIAIFNFAKEGFREPPMDYYLRPFSLAMEDHGAIWRNDHDCVVSKPETKVVLDYVSEFTGKMKKSNKPHFAFAFITRLTHQSVNKAGAGDDLYYNFIKNLDDNGHFENSVLFFFSDHGIRFGPIRETYIGKLEERLPFMFAVFPPWFYDKYPHLASNLRTNSHRLTTPFDMYETYKDVLYFTGKVPERNPKSRGISLFREIPESRTCDDASILPHWCTCLTQQAMDVRDDISKIAAKTLVDHINVQLADYRHLCEELTLEKITDARRNLQNDQVLTFKESLNDVMGRVVHYGNRAKAIVDYLLTVQTSPGQGLFEATVRHSEVQGTFKVMGEISRINKYGEQSSCIEAHKLKKLCYCK